MARRGKPQPTVQVRVHQETKDVLDRLSQEEDRPVTVILRRAVELYAERDRTADA